MREIRESGSVRCEQGNLLACSTRANFGAAMVRSGQNELKIYQVDVNCPILSKCNVTKLPGMSLLPRIVVWDILPCQARNDSKVWAFDM